MASDYIISTLPRVPLDPRTEQQVLEKALATIASASQGKLTDFSSSSVVGNIIKGQVFAHMELQWYLNKVVVAIAIELLRLFGVTRGLGTPSQGKLTVVLKNTLLSAFYLPTGYRFAYKGADTGAEEIDFITTEDLTILPGVNEGSVSVTASRTGEDTNVSALGFYQNNVNSPTIAYVYNKTPLEGGSSVEPLEETVARGQRSIRSRTTLVTVPEYEEAAKDYLGYGSQAKCYPTMNLGKEEGIMGHVHLICALPGGKVPPADLLAALRSSLLERSFATAAVWVSGIELFEVTLDVVINVNSLGDVDDKVVLDRFKEYLLASELGQTIRIKELEYLVRSCPGVTSVQYVTVNGDSLNTPLPSKFHTPRLIQLTLTKVMPDGTSITTYPEQIIDPD